MYPSTAHVIPRIQRWIDNVLVEVVEPTGVTRDWKNSPETQKEPQIRHNHNKVYMPTRGLYSLLLDLSHLLKASSSSVISVQLLANLSSCAHYKFPVSLR